MPHRSTDIAGPRTRPRPRVPRWRRAAVLAEALTVLAVTRAALLVLPFHRISRNWRPQGAEPASGHRPAGVAEVYWAMRAVTRRLPVFSRCLPQSIAAGWMLRRRHIAHTLCLGVRHEAGGRFLAHAWVRAAGRTVVGRRPAQEFQMLAAFAGSGGAPSDV